MAASSGERTARFPYSQKGPDHNEDARRGPSICTCSSLHPLLTPPSLRKPTAHQPRPEETPVVRESRHTSVRGADVASAGAPPNEMRPGTCSLV